MSTRTVALVTGGSRGIGRGVVVEAARRGHHVVFSHRGRADDEDATVSTALATAPDGVRVEGVVADMQTPSDLIDLAERARTLGPVEMLITCAGVLREVRLADFDLAPWQESWDVHVTAPMLLARDLESDLRAAGGAIVNVSSDGGVVGSIHGLPYGASKAGTVGLGHTLARELAPDVRVNTLAPGPIDTDMWAAVPEDDRRMVEETTPLGRAGRVEEVARAALDLASWTFVTGQTLVVNGGRVMR